MIHSAAFVFIIHTWSSLQIWHKKRSGFKNQTGRYFQTNSREKLQ